MARFREWEIYSSPMGVSTAQTHRRVFDVSLTEKEVYQIVLEDQAYLLAHSLSLFGLTDAPNESYDLTEMCKIYEKYYPLQLTHLRDFDDESELDLKYR